MFFVSTGSEESKQLVPEYWGAGGKVTVEIEENDHIPANKRSEEVTKQ